MKITEKIRFRRYKDIEAKNREKHESMSMYRVHEIKAYIDREIAGYIKVCYIPAEVFIDRIKDVWDFNQYGNGGHPRKFKNVQDKWKTSIWGSGYYTTPPSLKHLDNMQGGNWMKEEHYPGDEAAINDLAELAKDAYGLLKRQHEHYNMFVDKPHTDYIRVDEKFQRMGIATELHMKMAKWMNESFQLPYYSGSVQRPPAKYVWDKMIADGKPIYKEYFPWYGKMTYRYRLETRESMMV